MLTMTPLPRPRGHPLDPSALTLLCFALCIAHAVYLAAALLNGAWIFDPDGHGAATDFVNVWAAGKSVLNGQPAAAYNGIMHKQAEIAAVGKSFDGYYAWYYPPPFLAIAAGLALIPYAGAYAAWVLLTFPAYAAIIRHIYGHRVGWLLAGAFPAVLSNAIVGQNGFLTTALIGGTLSFMEKRPVAAGICLGLLTYKPHFGIVFPFVLLAAGRWRVAIIAAIVAIAMALASWLAFGGVTWDAFLHSLTTARQSVMIEGKADFLKLQSVFGLVRALGGEEQIALAAQGGVILAVIAALCVMWRSAIPYELKAAGLATGTLLASPYAYLYDLVILSVPFAFLLRLAARDGFLKGEPVALLAAAALVLVFPFVKAPVGLLAIAIVAALIARRAFAFRG